MLAWSKRQDLSLVFIHKVDNHTIPWIHTAWRVVGLKVSTTPPTTLFLLSCEVFHTTLLEGTAGNGEALLYTKLAPTPLRQQSKTERNSAFVRIPPCEILKKVIQSALSCNCLLYFSPRRTQCSSDQYSCLLVPVLCGECLLFYSLWWFCENVTPHTMKTWHPLCAGL